MTISSRSELVLLKNGAGEVTWPAYGVDQIGSWVDGQGYQVYMDNPATFSIYGTEIDPAQTPISLVEGWNMVAYLPRAAMPVGTALAGINSDLLLVKDGDGNVYWPAMAINDIGDMQPGMGYQIYMNNAAVLVYP